MFRHWHDAFRWDSGLVVDNESICSGNLRQENDLMWELREKWSKQTTLWNCDDCLRWWNLRRCRRRRHHMWSGSRSPLQPLPEGLQRMICFSLQESRPPVSPQEGRSNVPDFYWLLWLILLLTCSPLLHPSLLIIKWLLADLEYVLHCFVLD